MAATCWHSGLLQGPGQLFDLAAMDHPQSASRGLAELGVQGTTEVVDLHARHGVDVDNDLVIGGRPPVCKRSHVPPSPPEIRVSLDFQVSVGFGIVRLLSLRDSLLGPLLRLLDDSIPTGVGYVVPTKGLLACLWATSLSPGRDDWVFGLM